MVDNYYDNFLKLFHTKDFRNNANEIKGTLFKYLLDSNKSENSFKKSIVEFPDACID